MDKDITHIVESPYQEWFQLEQLRKVHDMLIYIDGISIHGANPEASNLMGAIQKQVTRIANK